MFAAMSVGVVAAPISPNYSLMPGGLARLQDIATLLRPSFVFVQDSEIYSSARKIPEFASAMLDCGGSEGWIRVDPFRSTRPVPARSSRRLFVLVDREAAAKILFHLGFDRASQRRDQYPQDDGEFASDGCVASYRLGKHRAGRVAPVASRPGSNSSLQRHSEAWRHPLYDEGPSGPAWFHKTIAI